ncbi:heme/hemin ABC transporter substrate-binding protein [Frateuria aurantia]|uniref:ABC-type hemin transport system, periplasmic component n=1 Tax=Frateuria aurantia (strain ATCC 33424 / DSM 6220 / KCTC 2777 / LMG 1558 / NBRC 3245 / NCIMB 13370) TaxID=767434 RepID=H8L438_FRAAD|nr:ABC transporter substrate-binding protein [Frateuria aurantia]AFC86514.1 ABC-type hemin transport system, periplasmic component [Frateuria aurantia DSM 6220]
MMRRRLCALATLLLASLAMSAAAADPQRVISLGGDVTEIVYALQAQSELVGVDLTSTWPAEAGKLAQVGYVRQLAAEGILALRPGLILATHDAGPPVVIRQLQDAGVKVRILPEARDPQAVLAKVRSAGHWLERDQGAARLAGRLDGQYRQLAGKTEAMTRHPGVLFLMSAGTAGTLAAGQDTAADAAIRLAGGRNVAVGFKGYKPLSAEALAALAPEVILLMSERADSSAEAVLSLPGIADTPAARKHQLIMVDGQALLGFGPRNAERELDLQQRLAAVVP